MSRLPTGPSAPADPARLFEGQRRRVWGLAYRLTGTREDADDIVQETFARLLEHAPALDERALPAWLVRVAANLGIDALRRRRRRVYPGVWLPAAVEADDDEWLSLAALAGSDPEADPEARYGLLESATLAYLVALEALGPRRRAVLLLRDVLGYTPAEVAALLGTSEGSVRVLHLRARRALADYDRARCVPDAALRARHQQALERFLHCLLAQDAAGLEALLGESVRTVTDAAGEFTALATPMVGRQRVARFYLRAARHRLAGGPSAAVRLVNGLPALVIAIARPVRNQAPRSVMAIDLDAAGAIRTIHTLLAPRKLAGVGFAGCP